MIPLYSAAQVRAAEEAAFRVVPEGALMQRASRALSISCSRLLTDVVGGVVGSRVVLLVGAGNNGGDALWAGAMLAARGCRVDAIALADRLHAEGAEALLRAGGRLHRWSSTDDGLLAVVDEADLVVDGIVGIGGTGALRPEAASLVARIGDAVVVAVDVPSGVDADTGAVAGAAVRADVTVTFGAAKPGLIVAPGCAHSGAVQVVDIGLEFDTDPVAVVLEDADVADWVPEPAEDAYKYRRGVVAVAAGSRSYPGAALLVTSAARRANVGMVRYLDRGDGNAEMVVRAYPDVVVDGQPPAEQARATAWACGSGFPGDTLDEITVDAVLASAVPVVLDAGALTVVAGSDGLRARIRQRAADGLATVLTPHDGEFERLQPGLLASAAGRAEAAAEAARTLSAVMVLKGPATVVADPLGDVYIDAEGTADLATAGSGDVLAGVVAGVLAGAVAEGRDDPVSVTQAVAAGVWLHGRAGRLAAADAPITATDIADAIPAAIRSARQGETP